MGTYRISEVAERTGFTSSALRFYERVGLLTPTDRTASGYRAYDDRSIEQLRFIGRAKQLGLSLDEITELTRLWSDDECAPVHHHMTQLVEEKRAMVAAQLSELRSFARQLDGVHDRLASGPRVGACDDSCGCYGPGADAIRLGRRAEHEPIPVACSLDAASAARRWEEWHEVLTDVVERTDIDDGVRLTFGSRRVAALADLVEQEQRCCPFFQFTIGVADAVTLEVRVPAAARPMLDELFGGAS